MSRQASVRAPHAADARREWVPAWLPPAVFLVATVVLFRRFLFSDGMLFGSDTLSLGYMARAFYAEAVRSGGFPLWNPLILGGTPFLESLAGGDSLYPTALFLWMTEPYRALGWKLVVHVFLAGVFMYAWVRALGLGRAAGMLAGLAYLMAPFFVTLIFPGHDGKMFVTALTPLAFWVAERSLSERGLPWLFGLSLVIGLVILTTHFQMAYFLFGALGAFYLFRVIQVGRVRGNWGLAAGRFSAFLLAALLGAGIAAIQFRPAVEYVTEFSRRTATTTEARSPAEAVAYGSSFSLHPEEAMSLVVPEFVGKGSEGYWGRNALKLNHEYIGLVVLLLAALSFFSATRRRALRWFLTGMGSVALLFALGRTTPVWRVLYEVLPGVSLFRAPSMVIFLVGFAAVTLMAFAVEGALGGEPARGEAAVRGPSLEPRVLWGAAGALAFGTVLWSTGILRTLWTSVLYSDIAPVRAQALDAAAPFIARGFVVATLLAAATAGVFLLLRRGVIGRGLFVAALAVLIGADALRVDDAFVQVIDFRAFAAPDDNIRFLQSRQAQDPPFRVLSLVDAGQDVRPGMFGLELAAGHHPNDLGRYRELIGMVGSGTPDNLLRNPALLALLNVRFLLWPEAQFGQPPFAGAQPVSRVATGDGRVLSAVYELPTLGRARLVGEAVVLRDSDAVAFMMSEAFQPERQVVLSEDPGVALTGEGLEGEVEWTERTPNRRRLSVRSSGPALLVIADNWYPAWRATVNGVDTPVLRAYHTLRAVAVPAGEGSVEMWYDAGDLRGNLWISLVALAVALLGMLAPALHRRWRPSDGKAGPEEPEPLTPSPAT